MQTLRNMWLGVTFFNPLLSFLSLCVLPVDDVIFYSTTVVARVARVVGDWLDRELLPGHSFLGPYLATWVSIDAFIVLSGAVRAFRGSWKKGPTCGCEAEAGSMMNGVIALFCSWAIETARCVPFRP